METTRTIIKHKADIDPIENSLLLLTRLIFFCRVFASLGINGTKNSKIIIVIIPHWYGNSAELAKKTW
jgi:hypothetical protein